MEINKEMGLEAWLSRQMLLGELLARYARKYPHHEVFIFRDQRVCFKEMDERVNRLSNALMAKGVSKGDKVGALMQNRQEQLEIFFAAAKIGAVNVPINIRIAPREMSYILNNADVKVLFVADNFINQIEQIRSELPLIGEYILVGSRDAAGYKKYESILSTGGPERPEVWLQDDDDACIMYTAGTTGTPKGAVLTHKSMVVNSMNLTTDFSLARPRRPDLPEISPKGLSIAPLFHIAGLVSALRMMIDLVPMVVISFTPLEFLKTVEKEKITFVFLITSMWKMVLDHPDFKKYDVSSLRWAGYGGEVTPNSLKSRILEAFPNAGLFEALGMTEMSATIVLMKHQDALRKEGSLGLPLRSVDVRVVDDHMNDVPMGEVGEIVYRGPGMLKGYYKNPEETREAFAGGWFHSGDLVRQDEEGFVYIVDRKKDMIISGGENIYSAEVEAVLHKHPAIKEASVIGIPDPKWGEVVKAFVVLHEGEAPTAEAVIQFCGEHLGKFKRPKVVEFIPDLPRSGTGKVLKRALRELE